jgi:hypothetical protein
MNTFFYKQEEKLITYKEDKAHLGGPPYNRSKYETLDYVLVPNRWKNAIKDVESDVHAEINSDHYPMKIRVQINLKAEVLNVGRREKWEYTGCNNEERDRYNNKLKVENEGRKDYNGIKEWIHRGATSTIPKKERGRNDEELSLRTQKLLEERRRARDNADMEVIRQLSKQIKKSIRQDRRDRMLEMVSTDLDARDMWMGIRQLKKGYQPLPYSMKDEKGKRVPMGNQANTAATFLEKQIWGKTDEQRNDENPHGRDAAPRIIIHEEVGINTGPITLYEVRKIVNKLKRRKTPGPDGIPIEFLKEMDDEALERVRALLNNWWGSEHIPEDVLRARVVLIFKEGDKEDLANYRPISLLNTIYKVLAAIVQDRIATKLDKFLQKTQYGFRQKRGTADAIHYVRRMIDKRRAHWNKDLTSPAGLGKGL